MPRKWTGGVTLRAVDGAAAGLLRQRDVLHATCAVIRRGLPAVAVDDPHFETLAEFACGDGNSYPARARLRRADGVERRAGSDVLIEACDLIEELLPRVPRGELGRESLQVWATMARRVAVT